MKTTKVQGLKVQAGLKAGALSARNHGRALLRIRSGIKAGASIFCKNHSRPALAIG